MTVDMSPEAVERLARELDDEAISCHQEAWRRLDGGQSFSLSAMLANNGAATLRALAAENARLRAENAAAYQRGAEAYNILSAAIKEQEAGNQRFAAIVSERVATGGPLSFAVEDLDGPDWEEAITRAIRALPIPDKEGE